MCAVAPSGVVGCRCGMVLVNGIKELLQLQVQLQFQNGNIFMQHGGTVLVSSNYCDLLLD